MGTGARQHGKREPLVMYGHWNRSSKPIRLFLQQCENVGLVAQPFEADIGSPDQGQKLESDTLRSWMASEPTGDLPDDYNDDEVDWTSYIFDDSMAPEVPPIFCVYKLEL